MTNEKKTKFPEPQGYRKPWTYTRYAYLTHRDASSRSASGQIAADVPFTEYIPVDKPWPRTILPAPTRLTSSMHTFYISTPFCYVIFMRKEERHDRMMSSDIQFYPRSGVLGFLQMCHTTNTTYGVSSPLSGVLASTSSPYSKYHPPFLNCIPHFERI